MPIGSFRRSFFLITGSLLTLALSGGSDHKGYPQGYFIAPVDGPLRLSGTFGELRPRHFHSGLDIKGSIGDPIYAAAGGFVARIGVSGGGYGNSLVLTHPNGYATLYAHLDAFAPSLARHVRGEQERTHRFEVELHPQPALFPVRRGELIGRMGTTGSSFGPHLHFEIRDTATDRPFNPLLFGLKIADRQPPYPSQIRLYQLDDRRRTLLAQTFDLAAGKDGVFSVAGETLYAATPQVGISLQVFDQMDGVPNRNGVYRLRMHVDDTLAYQLHFESFDFAESPFLNAHLDYEQQVAAGRYFHRLYRLPGNRLSIYDSLRHDGVVSLPAGRPVRILIEAADWDGNTSRISFALRQAPASLPPRRSFQYHLEYGRDNLIDDYSLYLFFPKGALYEPLDLTHQEWQDGSNGIYSAVHSVHNYRTPVHGVFDIGIRPTLLPDELLDKAFIAYCGPGGSVTNCGGKWVDGLLRASVGALGDYCIMVDDVAPRIEPLLFQKDMRRQERMTFRIRDNVAGRLNYEAEIDGEWALMEYDAKNDLLMHRFEEKLPPGEHRLRLRVSDGQGNTRILEEIFLR